MRAQQKSDGLVRPFPKGAVVRPFLGWLRDELLALAARRLVGAAVERGLLRDATAEFALARVAADVLVADRDVCGLLLAAATQNFVVYLSTIARRAQRKPSQVS